MEGDKEEKEDKELDHDSSSEALTASSSALPVVGGTDDVGNLRFGEYILSVAGETTRFIVYKDAVDDEVKGLEYQKLKEGVMVYNHNGFKRAGDKISWKRNDGSTYKGEVNAQGELTKGNCRALSFVRKKDKVWHTLFERDLVE